MKATLALAVLGTCVAHVAWAQGPTSVAQQPAQTVAAPEPSPITLAWNAFSRAFQLRKSFDGSKSENQAAAFGLVAPGNGSATYWLVDAGLQTKPFDWSIDSDGTWELFGFPSIEWHHMSAEPLLQQNATNKLSPAFSLELWTPPVTSIQLREHIVSKASVARNYVKDTTEKSVTAMLETCAEGPKPYTGLGWEGGARPCAELTYKGARRMHYYPYVGLEHYEKLSIQSSSTTVAPAFSGSMFVARVQADAYPFNTAGKAADIEGLVFNIDYAFRHALSDTTGLDTTNLNLLSLGATYFFVKNQEVGLGVTADVGRSPAVNFVSQRRIVLAVRLKTKTG